MDWTFGGRRHFAGEGRVAKTTKVVGPERRSVLLLPQQVGKQLMILRVDRRQVRVAVYQLNCVEQASNGKSIVQCMV